MSVWFVTPAWQRYAVSELCFGQRRWLMDRLAAVGIEAECLVVADDHNLDLARGFGFRTLERDNSALGKRFNDGIEYAAEQGATWIVPIGSDSWLAPAYIDPLPHPSITRTGTHYALISRSRIGEMTIPEVGPYMIHRDRLPKGGRPAEDSLRTGVDNSTLQGLNGLRWEVRDVHPLQYIAFRPPNVPQLHSYKTLYRRFGIRQHPSSSQRLQRVYPPELVAAARRMMNSHR